MLELSSVAFLRAAKFWKDPTDSVCLPIASFSAEIQASQRAR